MAEFLKGNYELPKGKTPKPSASPKKAKRKDLTSEFEERALSKLGGSLCFVMKKNTFVWSGEGDEAARQSAD